jgi:hypothetical protein
MANPVTKQDIQDALDQRESDNAFGVSLIPYHTHNGVDSPLVAGSATGPITSVTGTANQIDVTSGTTPVVSIDAGYVGQTSITTLASSIALTGSPTTTTQAALDDSTKISTTAYTDSAVTAYETAVATETNKRITKRVLALAANSATPAINTNTYDVVHITAQTAAITSFTTNLSGTPVDGDSLRVSVTGTAAVTLTWGNSFESSTVSLPGTTVTTARLDAEFLWNTETSKWRCVGVA